MASASTVTQPEAGPDTAHHAPDAQSGNPGGGADGAGDAVDRAAAHPVDDLHVPAKPVRVVTAASLFDGHDASINVMRRILQSQGAEVIHLGHNRSVDDVVGAAIDEDAHAVAVSSYQGGHVEYFRYLVDRLREEGRGDIRVYGGGGGVIVPAEIEALHAAGVARIFSPEDGQRMGLAAMVNTIIREGDPSNRGEGTVEGPAVEDILAGDRRALARYITFLEDGDESAGLKRALADAAEGRRAPVLGITGTGGSGKSSLTDELLRRFRLDHRGRLRVAVLAVDPTRRRSGGALLGDRIRMNALNHESVFMRSLATRGTISEVPAYLPDVVAACRATHDLVIVETPGIGQGDTGVVALSDVSLYVMTPEFGAPSQLEKIDMLDFADTVAINKFERRGAEDALRDVRRQLQRNRLEFSSRPEAMPVFGTVASRYDDDGVTALYQSLRSQLRVHGLATEHAGGLDSVSTRHSTGVGTVVPPARSHYLSDVAEAVRQYHQATSEQAQLARERQSLQVARQQLVERDASVDAIDAALAEVAEALGQESGKLLAGWPEQVEAYTGEEYVAQVGGTEVRTSLRRESLSGTSIPRVALPGAGAGAGLDPDAGELLRWLRSENLPGHFPFTAGVFPFKREGESPARMFAGEGEAARTNRRFHLLAEGQPASRLSTAFDSVTLYGFDPDERPDIYGKVGNSGVSVATLDDMKALYDGFDLCDPTTSVSMTINGPAPAILAMFFNTAIDQQLEAFEVEHGRVPTAAEADAVRSVALTTVRGTVQADILKEDQGQNTCIFSTELALRMMADVQEWFIEQDVRNFYSVSISGYHIAEAGANPITQLAFTLANAFTYVEAYKARGMDVDAFVPNLSFFFSSGMDPEYAVLGRVARRIWAVAVRDLYSGGERSQKLKYHIQTSGRSLHAQEMAFNDIRTTLQALSAVYDNCNSLHTNAYDEAVTTPTAASVRRALAIQEIIGAEWGVAANENPNQGSFFLEWLTDAVEEAVLDELERLSKRGGVLGAMETGYQRGRIQDESLLYEQRKHDGSLPLVGVNTFLPAEGEAVDGADDEAAPLELARSTEDEKQRCLQRLADFKARHQDERDVHLDALRRAVLSDDNVFGVLMDAVRHCTLGEVTEALFEVGGRYRRNV